MGIGSRQTTKAGRAGQASEIAQISAQVEEMRREFTTQKQELEQKINRLENELNQTRQTVSIAPGAAAIPTSRRRMLKKLGVAAAGLAAVSVASVASQEQTAFASTTYAQIGTAADTNTSNQVLSPTNFSTAAAPGNPPGLPISGGYNTLTISNNFTSQLTPGAAGSLYANPNDALVATSINGFAVNAQSNNQTAILGVTGTSSGITRAVPVNQPSSILGASDGVNGVNGWSYNNTGVYGFSKASYGIVAESGNITTSNGTTTAGTGAAFFIKPDPQNGPPLTGAHFRGEVHVDAGGNWYICQTGGASAPTPAETIRARFPSASPDDVQRAAVGAAPVWSLIGGASFTPYNPPVGTTINFLSTPTRLYGNPFYGPDPKVPASVYGANPQFNPLYLPVSGTFTNGSNVQTIPAGATAVLATLVAYNNGPSATGFATVYPANAAPPTVATVVYTGFTSTLIAVGLGTIPSGSNSGKNGIGIVTNLPIGMTFDVVAYWT